MLPMLQKSKMSFGLPSAIATPTGGMNYKNLLLLLFQNGGELYTKDAKATLLDSPTAVDAFSFMTSLYTDYGLYSRAGRDLGFHIRSRNCSRGWYNRSDGPGRGQRLYDSVQIQAAGKSLGICQVVDERRNAGEIRQGIGKHDGNGGPLSDGQSGGFVFHSLVKSGF